MLDSLAFAPADVMTVTRIDRPARTTFDLFAIIKQIVDAKAGKCWKISTSRFAFWPSCVR
jgi:hypothetical protein